jgi:hypothetical protein
LLSRAGHRSRAWLAVAAALLAPGCIADLFQRSAGFDQRPLTVQTISFFDQRQPTRLTKKNWKGDWIFRRDRLEMIDTELRGVKPDVLLAQGVMGKRGSASETDASILRAGALADYEWREAPVESFEDTQELETMVIALGVPIKFAVLPGAEREVWVMGAGGYLMMASVDYEDQPVTVVNVQLPLEPGSEFLWYSFVQERVTERLRRLKHCGKRIIVAGQMPGDEGARRFGEFVRALRLKDAALGFCQIDSGCYTATPSNDIFMATVGEESPSRVDRIFLHQSAVIYSSRRDFEESDPSNRYAHEFGLARLWSTQRFGWVTSARLARCTPDELDGLP